MNKSDSFVQNMLKTWSAIIVAMLAFWLCEARFYVKADQVQAMIDSQARNQAVFNDEFRAFKNELKSTLEKNIDATNNLNIEVTKLTEKLRFIEKIGSLEK